MHEWTIGELHEAYRNGTTDPVTVCREYLDRIEQLDQSGPSINSIIEVNPDALDIAEERAKELDGGASRRPAGVPARRPGLLHGIPVLIKDNIDTHDAMKTTAGSLALVDAPRPHDAYIVRRLREEGAIILGKTNLSEWANFRSSHSNSGWSSRGGQTRNPYVLDRSPCGSSSGSGAAVAANLAVVAIGTETDGSVTCPSANNSLVGLKPTLGTVSRTGIVPIAASQDTAGPMARTVADAAVLLQAIAGRDPEDNATFDSADYLAHLDAGYLRGKRIGVVRNRAVPHRGSEEAFERALATLRMTGAELVDPADLPDFTTASEYELTVLLYEFKQGLADYFSRRNQAVESGEAPIRTIEDVVAFNNAHADEVLKLFGQEHMLSAAECGPLTDEKYTEAVRESRRITGPDGLEALLREHRLDAIVAPTNGPAWIIDHLNGDYYTGGRMSTGPAVSGYPHVTLPMGYYHELPLGISFVGGFKEDAKLLGLAHAFEQVARIRKQPRFVESVGLLG